MTEWTCYTVHVVLLAGLLGRQMRPMQTSMRKCT